MSVARSENKELTVIRQILFNKDSFIVSYTVWDCFSKYLSTINFFLTVAASSCEDNSKYKAQCPGWAKNGECQKTPAFMKVNCRKSCNACGKHTSQLCCLFWHLV